MQIDRRIIIAVLVLAAATAHADPKPLVFPLAAPGAHGKLAGAAPAVTRALADAIGGDVAKVTLEVAAEVFGCDVESAPCLEQVADSLGTRRLVFGTIALNDRTVRVTLTRFDRGSAPQRRAFELAARTTDELATALVRAASPLLDLAAPEPSAPPVVAPREAVPPKPEVTTGTWLVIGSGATLAVVGAGFLGSAYSLRSEVENAPMHSDADFLRLRELERRGTTRAYTGDVLVAVGGAVVAAGVIRAVIQRSSGRTDSRAPRIAIAPITGGAAVVVSLGLR
jgi:hypothetical protein